MTAHFVSFGSVVLLGVLLVAALWPREASRRGDLPLILPLGILAGFGATSVLFFAASLLTARPAPLCLASEIALSAGLAWGVSRRVPAPSARSAPAPATLDWVLATVLVQAVAFAAVIAWRAYRAEPYGGWDGWAIWNLHARFMLRAGPAWPHELMAPQLSWSHPDYPWLVPASVAREWAWTGHESAAAAATISALFGAALVALLVAIMARLRGSAAALLAGLLLVGTPFFVTFSTNEHADLPLAAYLLATMGLLALGRPAALAGLCAGFAAWTKNEGLLFVLVVTVWLAWQARTEKSWTGFRRFVIAAAIGLAPVAYFKLALAPSNDLVATPLAPRLLAAMDAGRHATIFAALWRDLRGFGEWTWLPYVAMALPFGAWRARRRLVGPERGVPLVLGAMFVGYYGVYLLTPQDLAWHLETSLVRLLLQLWPLALLWWALAVLSPAALPAGGEPRRWTWAAFLGANAIVGLALVASLSSQPAPDELALRRRMDASVCVAIDEGWHGVEQQARQRWAWSRGAATLSVEVDRRATTAPTLRFSLRSLAARTVTIRMGERTLWQGRVAESYVPVTLAPLPISAGTATLAFTTDAPTTPEPGGPRQLAFAIYNVRID